MINTSSVVDPVCGMAVDPQNAAGSHEYNGVMYYFCSASCHDAFVGEPGRYVPTG
jgi:Cu+-exporting ATPase